MTLFCLITFKGKTNDLPAVPCHPRHPQKCFIFFSLPVVKKTKWCHCLPVTSHRVPEPLLGLRSLPVSLLLPVRRDGWLVQADADLRVGTACWVPRLCWCENSTQFWSNLLRLQLNHGRAHSHSHFLAIFCFCHDWVEGVWLWYPETRGKGSLFFLFSDCIMVVCLKASLVVGLCCWPVVVWLSLPAGPTRPYTPEWLKRLRPNWSLSPASSKTESHAYGSAPFQVRRWPVGRHNTGHTDHKTFKTASYWFMCSQTTAVLAQLDSCLCEAN